MLFKSDFLRTLQERGYINQCTDPEELDTLACAGPITAYVGFDPTADSLHVGNLVSLMMLRVLHHCGGTPIALIGDATAMVGDPSDKNSARPMLTKEIIAKNSLGFYKTFDTILGPPDNAMSLFKTKIVQNSHWLSELNYIEFLRDIGPHFTINRMLSMDFVKNRIDNGIPLTFLEFNYMILQACDFVQLNRRLGCVLQMGGSDQWGNIVNGLELARRIDSTKLFGLTTHLITTASGVKMGKTVDGAVWLKPDKTSPYEYYQFWRNTEDADVERFMKLFTDLPMEYIAEVQKLPVNQAKYILAFEATAVLHGKEAARKAVEASESIFNGAGGDISALPSILFTEGLTLVSAAAALFGQSKSEIRRKMTEGAIHLNGNVVADDQTVKAGDRLSFGKKKHGVIK